MRSQDSFIKKIALDLSPALLALLAWLLTLWAKANPFAVERIYSRGIYPSIARGFAWATQWLPVSLSELLLLALPIVVVVLVVLAVRRVIGARLLLRVFVCLVSALYLAFTALWGLNYHRLPYSSIAGLDVHPSTAVELEALCQDLANQANRQREALMGDSTAAFSLAGRDAVLQKTDAAYALAGETYPWLLGGGLGNPKFAILSTPLAHMQVSGIFSPFTLEAHVTRQEADSLLGATACHEAAHLRGFAREDEANFISYLVCQASKDDYLMYSGTLLALIHAGNALHSADSARYQAVRQSYSAGVVADLQAYSDNWRPFEGKAAEVHQQVNDAYLKANGLEDGVRSYGRMVDLMLAMRREQHQ